MKRTAFRIVGALLAMLLAACSSTASRPQARDATGSTGTSGVDDRSAAAAQTSPAATVTASSAASGGPITPSMAQLQLDGERFATMGDPNAPLTMIEFSDYG